MLTTKKAAAACLSVLLFSQQLLAANPLASALQRDKGRFARKEAAAQQVSLQPQAYAKLEEFNKKTDSSWQIRINRKTGAPRALVNGRRLQVGRGESGALSFLNKNKDFLGVDRRQLKLNLQRKSAVGEHYYFDQYYKNLKVEGAYVKVNVDKQGNLLNYQSTYIPDIKLDIKPVKTASEAAAIAAADAAGKPTSAAQLIVYPRPLDQEPVLAWKVTIEGGPMEPGKWAYYVGDQNGQIYNRISRQMQADLFVARLNPVYPGFSGAEQLPLPMQNLYVNYFTALADGTNVMRATNSSGNVENTRSHRIFTSFNGPYFTISNQKGRGAGVPSGFYVEQGLDGTNVEPISFLWHNFTPANNNTYSPGVCGAGSFPIFAAPVVKSNFSVGAMDVSGIITKRAFLQFLQSPSVPLAKYIGVPGVSFTGPIYTNISPVQGQTASYSLTPPGASGNYEVEEFTAFCAPVLFGGGYAKRPVHIIASEGYNEAEASAFYNLNAMRGYFIGLGANNYINLNTHFPVIINAFGHSYSTTGNNGMANAFYDLEEKFFMFGEGLYTGSSWRNFALEAAIVRHEYVHAVMDMIWPIWYFGEGAAIAEALADYFALSSLVGTDDVTPYTSSIGAYVAVGAGEGIARNLSGNTAFNAQTWVENTYDNYHQNGLVLSQALWKLRNGDAAAYKLDQGRADEIIFNALFFFPDSLIEVRDAVLAVANALHPGDVAKIEAAFDAHNINYDSVITASGDIYEPNNSPGGAADIDVVSIARRELNAAINPVSDMDYYSVALPEGAFKATLYMSQVPQIAPARYYPLSMAFLDAHTQTLVDIIKPTMTEGATNQSTADETIALIYDVPSLANGSTGRFILAVFKPREGAYPLSPDAAGAYKLVFEFAPGSNIGGVQTSVNDFADGTEIEFNAPYNQGSTIQLPAFLSDWATSKIEAFHHARLLDADLKPIEGA
ncbi:MAG: hypothetical protein LBR90_02060, partial [Elusimicrobiota bacterium]|nr:hypothetical protein [Elusimicrobiota bacterium]